MDILAFASDYQEGAHPAIIKKLTETNLFSTSGYGLDEYSNSARDKIRKACSCPKAEVQFLIGGTQTNATIIDSILRSYEGVIAATSGHVAVHEAGAIEYGGHKVLALKGENGKISAGQIESFVNDCRNDGNADHMVQPGMVYISQPTEYGTIYSLKELEDISRVCHDKKIKLYVDGARLAYSLGAPENDVSLKDLARLCDVFYIGGTKCGALFGEAVVIPEPSLIPHFFTIIKQHGALLAKGRISGIQFDQLFTDDLYFKLGKDADLYAARIKKALQEKGYKIFYDSPTNQVFFVIENSKLEALGKKVLYAFGEKYDDTHTVIRFCTSWATTSENTDKLIEIIKTM